MCSLAGASAYCPRIVQGYLGAALAELGGFDEATAQYKRALELQPNQPYKYADALPPPEPEEMAGAVRVMRTHRNRLARPVRRTSNRIRASRTHRPTLRVQYARLQLEVCE